MDAEATGPVPSGIANPEHEFDLSLALLLAGFSFEASSWPSATPWPIQAQAASAPCSPVPTAYWSRDSWNLRAWESTRGKST